ncbi:MAG: AMP-dependent synthetase/ligase [Alphaproteobacteria bacterium]
MNKKNQISSILNSCENLFDIFNYHFEKTPYKKVFFKKKKQWESSSFYESSKRINKIISFFTEKKIKKGDRIFLLSNNRVEWVEFDLAIMMVGGITVPSFVTNNRTDNEYIIKDSKPKFIILENESVYKKNENFLNKLINKIIFIDSTQNFMDYEKIILKKSRKIRKIKVSKNDISSIIYTSGTTGNPKGVVLTHKSIMHNLIGASELICDFNLKNERFISFLPLSHSYERMAGLYFPILIGAEIYFCSSTDKLLTEIKEVKPTILSAVPRLYENIFTKIKSQVKKSNFIISNLLMKSFLNIETETKKINFIEKLLIMFFLRFILKRKVLGIFGNKIKVLISGGAALNPTVGFFFKKLGISLLQGYGQTEASPLISCNRKNNNNPNTVGRAVKNVKVKISNYGEILVSGDNLMLGYWKQKKLTNKTIKNGWLHTGDLGKIDDEGRIIITGRKKELIVTSGGENISSQRIENMFLNFEEISHAIIFGDGKPFLIALIRVSDEHKNVNLKRLIENLNKNLNTIEKIRKFILMDIEPTYENGLMTQTMKIKKEKVFLRYKNQIDSLYRTL